jgi:hypothetical protein
MPVLMTTLSPELVRELRDPLMRNLHFRHIRRDSIGRGDLLFGFGLCGSFCFALRFRFGGVLVDGLCHGMILLGEMKAFHEIVRSFRVAQRPRGTTPASQLKA